MPKSLTVIFGSNCAVIFRGGGGGPVLRYFDLSLLEKNIDSEYCLLGLLLVKNNVLL